MSNVCLICAGLDIPMCEFISILLPVRHTLDIRVMFASWSAPKIVMFYVIFDVFGRGMTCRLYVSSDSQTSFSLNLLIAKRFRCKRSAELLYTCEVFSPSSPTAAVLSPLSATDAAFLPHRSTTVRVPFGGNIVSLNPTPLLSWGPNAQDNQPNTRSPHSH